MQHSSTTDTYNINNTMNISKTNLTSTSTATQMTPKTSTIPNTKQNLNIIHLNKDLKQPHTTSKSPELKPTDKKIPLKGMNIIPIRQQTTADKISPRNVITKTATNFGINSSPKGVASLKFPANTKLPTHADTRTQFEIKNSSYKSPSPGKGITSTLNKYLKKSPEVKK
jgi:hypothetical protein